MYILYTIHWDKTQMLKIFTSDKINGTKNALFLFREFQLITVLLLICDSYIAWWKSGTRTPGPSTSDTGSQSKFKSGTPGPPAKYKGGAPSPFFNEFIIFRIFHLFFTYLIFLSFLNKIQKNINGQ